MHPISCLSNVKCLYTPRCHPGSGTVIGAGSSLATQPIVVEYFGHTSVTRLQHYYTPSQYCFYSAHAAAAPWEGQNALDAAVLAYNSVSVLRQQIRPECRVHGIIEGRNWEPNGGLSLHAP